MRVCPHVCAHGPEMSLGGEHMAGCAQARTVHTSYTPICSPTVQVDLFDLASHGHRTYRHVLNYTCRYTKFVWLRPLRKKTSELVAQAVSVVGA